MGGGHETGGPWVGTIIRGCGYLDIGGHGSIEMHAGG